MGTNLFQQLEQVLGDLDKLLSGDKAKAVKSAISELGKIEMFQDINSLVETLIALFETLKGGINDFDFDGLPGVSEISELSGLVSTLLDTSDALEVGLGDVELVRKVTNVTSGLATFQEAKARILISIGNILSALEGLKG